MNKVIFSFLTSLCLLGGLHSFAQNDDARKATDEARAKAKVADEQARNAENMAREITKGLKDENGEIVIKTKDLNKTEKLTIEIKDNKVFVNNQPIENFVNDDVSVTIRNPRRYNLNTPGSPFRFQGNTWSLENDGPGEVHPFLGVMTEKSADGAKVVSVTESSAAAKAGLQKDDIITKINGKAVADHNELSEAIAALKPDDKIDITYTRNGKENKTTAVLGKRPTSRRFKGGYFNPERPEAPELPEGMEAPVPPIPPMNFNFDDFGRNFNMGKPRLGIRAQDTDDNKGVKVIGVDDESAAEKAGLKEDDLITSFDGKKVNSADELAEAARASKDKSSVKLQVKRNGKNQDIELKVPKKLKTADL